MLLLYCRVTVRLDLPWKSTKDGSFDIISTIQNRPTEVSSDIEEGEEVLLVVSSGRLAIMTAEIIPPDGPLRKKLFNSFHVPYHINKRWVIDPNPSMLGALDVMFGQRGLQVDPEQTGFRMQDDAFNLTLAVSPATSPEAQHS